MCVVVGGPTEESKTMNKSFWVKTQQTSSGEKGQTVSSDFGRSDCVCGESEPV